MKDKSILIKNVPESLYYQVLELKARMKCDTWIQFLEKLLETKERQLKGGIKIDNFIYHKASQSVTMTETEKKAFKWLLKQGVTEEEIFFHPTAFYDFVLLDGKKYEAKHLKWGAINFNKNQYENFKVLNPTILVFSDDSDNPVAVAPFNEIQQKVKVRGPY